MQARVQASKPNLDRRVHPPKPLFGNTLKVTAHIAILDQLKYLDDKKVRAVHHVKLFRNHSVEIIKRLDNGKQPLVLQPLHGGREPIVAQSAPRKNLVWRPALTRVPSKGVVPLSVWRINLHSAQTRFRA